MENELSSSGIFPRTHNIGDSSKDPRRSERATLIGQRREFSDAKFCLLQGISLFRCSRPALNREQLWRETLSAKIPCLVPWQGGYSRRRPDEASIHSCSALFSASIHHC